MVWSGSGPLWFQTSFTPQLTNCVCAVCGWWNLVICEILLPNSVCNSYPALFFFLFLTFMADRKLTLLIVNVHVQVLHSQASTLVQFLDNKAILFVFWWCRQTPHNQDIQISPHSMAIGTLMGLHLFWNEKISNFTAVLWPFSKFAHLP